MQAGDLLAQLEAPPCLATIPCRVCGTPGAAIFAMRADERGAHEFAWCSVDCARTQGWPWLRSERQPRRRHPIAAGNRRHEAGDPAGAAARAAAAFPPSATSAGSSDGAGAPFSR